MTEDVTIYWLAPSSCISDLNLVFKVKHPRVQAGKNTSTVIPASRKRRRKGNPVVSDLYILYLCVPCGSRSKQK
jgi:hypothetical protein